MKSKKTIKSIVLSAIIIISTLLFVTNSFASDTAKISVETARLRQEPSENSTILDLISIGENVEVLEKSGDWYKVKFKGITGYLRNDLLKVNGSTQNEVQKNETSENNTTSQSTDNKQNTQNENNAQLQENNNVESQENANNEPQENTNIDTQENNPIDSENKNNETAQDTINEEEYIGEYQFIEDTKIRITPLINSLVIAEVKANDIIKVTDKVNEWALVENENNQGWIRVNKLKKKEEKTQEPVITTNSSVEKKEEKEETNQNQQPQVQEKTMYVNSQTVNVRAKADKTSQVVKQLSLNTQVKVTSEENGWAKITFNGGQGYIASNLLSDKKQETSRGVSTSRVTETEVKEQNVENTNNTQQNVNSNEPTSNSSKGADVLAYAMKFIGYPYVYGGMSTSGFDCSGFTSYVYKHFGVTLNRTAGGQFSNGTSVSRGNLQPGDLVMFGSPINHVGIYAGGGRIVHAANPSRGITTDTINSGYYNTHYKGARRIF